MYSEVFDSRDAIDTLSDKSIEFTAIIKRSMHDEILMSISRLFDSDGYSTKNGNIEYLSQRNVILGHEHLLNEDLKALRAKTSKLWAEVEVKQYRDFKLAHNDKELLLGSKESVKHKVTFQSAIDLIETSMKLVLGIMVETGNTSVMSNLNEKYEGVGDSFIMSIQ